MARGRPAKDGLHTTSPAATIPDADDTGQWRALGDGYRAGLEHGYSIGYADGRACACVALAEMEERRESVAWWREWSAKLQRIIQADADPSVRMRQVMAEIARRPEVHARGPGEAGREALAVEPVGVVRAESHSPGRSGGCGMTARRSARGCLGPSCTPR